MYVGAPFDIKSNNNQFETGQNDVRFYVSLLWHWTWLIILAALLAGGAAFLISQRITPIYETTSKLLIIEASSERVANYQDVLTSERLTSTYSEMMVNQDILNEVIDMLSMQISVEDLRKMVEITPVRDTQLISIEVEGEDPNQIADIANSIVDIFTEQINSIQAGRYSNSLESLSIQMKDIEAIIQRIQDRIDEIDAIIATQSAETDPGLTQPNPNNPERENLAVQALQYQQIYSDLLTSYEETRLAETQSASNIIQVNKAIPPEEPISPNILLNTVIGGLSAAILAIGFIFTTNLFNNTINTPEQVENILGLSVLGVIFHHKKATGLISLDEPLSPISEAFRSLRTNIQFFNTKKDVKSLLVTSPTRESGKSLVSSNLAVFLAQGGTDVILADVDLRRPTIHKKLNLPNDSGLTSLFRNPKKSIESEIKKTTTDNLSVITSGDLPPNPSELLGSQHMTQLIEILENKADMVIFDSPPVLPVSDAVVMAALVDGVLLVIQPGKTPISAARQTIKNINRVNAKIIGVVFNNVKIKRSVYGKYYYNDDYASDWEQTTRADYAPAKLNQIEEKSSQKEPNIEKTDLLGEIPLRKHIKKIEELLASQKIDSAISDAENLLEEYPKNIAIHGLLGKAYLKKQKYDHAKIIFENILLIDPDDFASQIGLSIISERVGEFEKSYGYMLRAFEMEPSNKAIQAELKRLHKANTGLEPDQIYLTNRILINMYASTGLIEKAISAAQKGIREDPTRIDYKIQLASLLYSSGKKTEAREMCMDIINILPYCRTALCILCKIIPPKEKPNGSDIYKLRLIEIDPDFAFMKCEYKSTNEIQETAVMVENIEEISNHKSDLDNFINETWKHTSTEDDLPISLRGFQSMTEDKKEKFLKKLRKN